MPVGVNQEALGQGAIFAYDGTNYRAVKCDANGQILAAIATGQTLEVTQDTPGDLKATVNIAASQSVGVTQSDAANLKATANIAADQNIQSYLYGRFSAAWQKQPLMFGFGGTCAGTYDNLSLAAGTNTYNFAAVPANQVYVVTNLLFIYIGTITNVVLTIEAILSGTAYTIFSQKPPASNSRYDRQGWWVLAAGDNIRFTVEGATLNDDAYARYLGFYFNTNL